MSAVEYGRGMPLQIRQKRQELAVVPPEVYIYWSAWAEIRKLVELALPNETSGLGTVKVIDGKLVITDVEFIGGEHSPGFTDIQNQLPAYMEKLDREGKADQLAQVHLWFHSHGGGDVFWSSIDEGTMNSEVIADYLIAIVVNSRGEMACHVSIFRPVFVAFDGLPLQLWMGPGDDKSISQAMTEAVTSFNEFTHKPGLLERWFGSAKKPEDQVFGPTKPPSTDQVVPGKVVTGAQARHEAPSVPTATKSEPAPVPPPAVNRPVNPAVALVAGKEPDQDQAAVERQTPYMAESEEGSEKKEK